MIFLPKLALPPIILPEERTCFSPCPHPLCACWDGAGKGEHHSALQRRAPIPLTLSWQVNIDHFTKAVTIKNLVEPSPTSFDMAQKRIFALMEKDSLPRFVRSEFYHELIK